MDQLIKEHKKLKGKKSKVSPANGPLDNTSFELEMASEAGAGESSEKKFQTTVKHKINPLVVMAKAKTGASKWRSYVCKKRQRKKSNKNHPGMALTVGGDGDEPAEDEEENPQSGTGLDDIDARYLDASKGQLEKFDSSFDVKLSLQCNRALMQYFAKLGQSKDDQEGLNLDFVETLIEKGADINCCDIHGQTILHEVARAWHCDVARFLLAHKVDVNKADSYGRTPLHVAAAVDYPEMVNLLIENKADKEARTKEENQTPVHYAAKNDAVQSLKALIKKGCQYKMVRDFKGRTPIHVAAELDRSETARFLLDLQAPVGVNDDQGMKAITWMITKMAPVAHEALQQFRHIDRPNRKQYFYLNLLCQDKKLDPASHSPTPLSVAVVYKQYDLLMHPVFQTYLNLQWSFFAVYRAWWFLIVNFLYILIWTVIGISVEYDQRYIYVLPDQWWRVILWVLAVGFTSWQLIEEFLEFFRSKRSHRNWVVWRTKEINRDMKFCHLRWPEEKRFLESELEALENQSPKYFKDWWNIFDWLCYVLLIASITSHVVDVIAHSEAVARAHIRIMCVTIILLWLRLMKNIRPFSLLGPFIVMLGHMLLDVLRFIFIYLEFFIPFCCAFWMIFGGDKKGDPQSNVNGTVVVDYFQYPGDLIFSLFRLTLVDEYDYTNMRLIDPIMANLLLFSWFAISAILCLNLLIALLSDTFQRVYDNAQANSVMQRAIIILSIWDSMWRRSKDKFLTHITDQCSPLTQYYDDDLTEEGEEDMKKVTMQVKEELDELMEQWKLKFGTVDSADVLADGLGRTGEVVTVERLQREVGSVRDQLRQLETRQQEMTVSFRQDMGNIQSLIKDLIGLLGGGGGGQGEGEDVREALSREGSEAMSLPSQSGRRRKKKQRGGATPVGGGLDPIPDEMMVLDLGAPPPVEVFSFPDPTRMADPGDSQA